MTTKVEKTITVDAPVRVVYNQWTQFEEFPEFMGGVSQVRQLDDQRLHWVAEIAGVRREWDAAILEQVPDQKIAWAATAAATPAAAAATPAATALPDTPALPSSPRDVAASSTPGVRPAAPVSTVPRQPPLAVPFDSMNRLNFSRSDSAWRLTNPTLSPTDSSRPSGSYSMVRFTRVRSGPSGSKRTAPAFGASADVLLHAMR